MRNIRAIAAVIAVAGSSFSCSDIHKDDYADTSPTSGRLKVYYDEGMRLHVRNQVYTFESQYEHVTIETVESNDDRSVSALLNDSCEAIVISRQLGTDELQQFRAKRFEPKYTHVATSGIAFITSAETAINTLEGKHLGDMLAGNAAVRDSTGSDLQLRFLIDRNNSSVMRYLLDSVTLGRPFGRNCSSLGSTTATIEFVAANAGAVGVIDFSWLSDRDDSLFKHYAGKIKFIGVTGGDGSVVYPSQSSFKLGTYPFAREVYVVRKTGEFTLAKGFQSFVAGPKGQLTFLKQGLLPARQAERNVEIRIEPLGTE